MKASLDISFYIGEQGDNPVFEFLNSLNAKEIGKCLAYMHLLAEEGNSLPANYIKHIDGDLWELRPEFGGQEFRFFYFIVLSDTILFLHAFKKKTQKTSPTEIEIARKRMEEVRPVA